MSSFEEEIGSEGNPYLIGMFHARTMFAINCIKTLIVADILPRDGIHRMLDYMETSASDYKHFEEMPALRNGYYREINNLRFLLDK